MSSLHNRIAFLLLAASALLRAQVGPDLYVRTFHHSAVLLSNQTNALFITQVTNLGTAASSGTVTVTLTAPNANFQLTSLSGSGWSCSGTTCSRSDALAPGQNYPSIRAIYTAGTAARASLTYTATLSGGGDNNSANNVFYDTVKTLDGASIFAWGEDDAGQVSGPNGAGSNVVSIAAGARRTMAVLKDGTVQAWGANDTGQNELPSGLDRVDSVAVSDNFSVALNLAGTVVAWPSATTHTPAGLTDIVEIAAGEFHSLCLKADGTVVAGPGTTLGQGDNTFGQTQVPIGLSNVIHVAAGWGSSFALKSDGSIVAWGANPYPWGPITPTTSGSLIAAGPFHTLVGGGGVLGWGSNGYGESASQQVYFGRVTALAAGAFHSLALSSTCRIACDGQGGYDLLAWGGNRGESDAEIVNEGSVPTGYVPRNDIFRRTDLLYGVAAGFYHSVILGSVSKVSLMLLSNAPDTPIYVDGQQFTAPKTVTVWPDFHSVRAQASYADSLGSHWAFTGWSDGSTNLTDTVFWQGGTLTANYVQQVALTTQATTGGTITPSSSYYTAGSVVTITATPNPGYAFMGFTGAVTSASNPLSFTITGNQTVTANFSPVATPELHLSATQLGPYTQGGQSATYLYVTDRQNPTSGTVTVTVSQPAPDTGLNIVSVSGTGWSCSGLTCSRTDALSVGATYPFLKVLAFVTGAASTTAGFHASVSGGGDPSSADANSKLFLSSTVVPPSLVIGWGENYSGQTTVPAGLTNVCNIAAAGRHSLALNCDGTVAAWGANQYYYESLVPESLKDVVALAPSDQFNVALLADGTAVKWGGGFPVFATTLATNITAISSGEYGVLTLAADGTVRYYGSSDPTGMSNIPAGLKAVAIGAGWGQAYAIRNDGVLIGWGSDPDNGSNIYGSLGNVAPGVSVKLFAGPFNWAAIVPGSALRASNVWGTNYFGETNVPLTSTGVQSIAWGAFHAVALYIDDVVLAWGSNQGDGGATVFQSVVPGGLRSITAVAAGFYHSLALTHP